MTVWDYCSTKSWWHLLRQFYLSSRRQNVSDGCLTRGHLNIMKHPRCVQGPVTSWQWNQLKRDTVPPLLHHCSLLPAADVLTVRSDRFTASHHECRTLTAGANLWAAARCAVTVLQRAATLWSQVKLASVKRSTEWKRCSWEEKPAISVCDAGLYLLMHLKWCPTSLNQTHLFPSYRLNTDGKDSFCLILSKHSACLRCLHWILPQ